MENLYNEVLYKLNDELNDYDHGEDYPIQSCETIIIIILKALSDLKTIVLNRGFKNIDEEIYFFKYQKPVIVAKLIYYNAVFKLETKKPTETKAIKKVLNKELAKLKGFFNSNLEFYKYYRTNNSFIDDKLFLRGKHDLKLSLDTVYFESDHRFSTSHDFKVAKIIANDQIQIYIEKQLYNLKNGNKIENKSLNWTGSKTALTELVYALYSQGVFDNGNADIKGIAKTLERVFNIDLGDFYHTFMELSSRKINRTKFIDSLRDSLLKKMDEKEE